MTDVFEGNTYKYHDILEELLAKELRQVHETRKARRNKREWFSASNAGFCPRATILNRLNAKEVPYTDKQLRTFWIGNTLHSEIERIAKRSGRLVASEVFVGERGKDLVIGAVDLIVKNNDGLNILYENKSIGTGSFWTSVMKEGKPNKHHIFQGVTYWILNKKYRVDALKITYLSKQDGAMRSFWIDITDNLIKEVKDWWAMVDKDYQARKLPDPLTDEKEQKHFCKGCTFGPKYCFYDENIIGQTKADLEQNIMELDWDGNKKTEGEFTVLEKPESIKVQNTKLHEQSEKNKTTRTRKKSNSGSDNSKSRKPVSSLRKGNDYKRNLPRSRKAPVKGRSKRSKKS